MQRTTTARVLVVESAEERRAALVRTLAARGYSVVASSGVYDALRLAQRPAPDVIVADVSLPDGNGKSFIRALRAIASTARVPVVAIAAAAETADTRGLLADCVLREPFSDDMLVETVAQCARRSQLADAAPGTRWETPAGGVSLVAPDGTRWSVHHIHSRDARTPESLMFVSRAGYLRVKDFPENWRALPTEQLLGLSALERAQHDKR